MSEPRFFKPSSGLDVSEIVSLTGAELRSGDDPNRRITNIAALDRAGPHDLAFLDNVRYADQLATSRAGACILATRFAGQAPQRMCVLSIREPYRAFVQVACRLFPEALRPASLYEAKGVDGGALVHPSAKLEAGVTVDPGAVIGPRAEIGSGTIIAPNAVVGPDVRIGRDCAIGPGSSVSHTLIGDRVIIHAGVRIGQDGFGYVMGPKGHQKVPQTGRVIVQDDVEIGAGTTIDRGANRDTVIGEGTKIDNLVQIAHNVVIGRHCIVVAQSGLSGSATLEDYVVLGARVGLNNHVTIGEGAQLAALTIVNSDVPPGARYGGFPAKPAKQWFREIKAIERLGRGLEGAKDGREDDQ